MLESKIQSACINHAKKNGWIVLKVIRCNINGFPDATFFKDGKTFFVEFKTEIGKQSKLQENIEKQLVSSGFNYFVIRNLKDFQNIIIKT